MRNIESNLAMRRDTNSGRDVCWSPVLGLSQTADEVKRLHDPKGHNLTAGHHRCCSGLQVKKWA